MMKKTPATLLTAILLSGLAYADPPRSLDEAVSQARDRYPGRVLSAETEQRGDRESYRIRILTDDGRVKRLRMDGGPRQQGPRGRR